MKCLWCGKEMQEGSLRDLIIGSDPLCSDCRGAWMRKDIRFQFQNVPLYSFYVYGKAFSSCLIQYKELGDEALAGIFLHEIRGRIRRLFHGYTLVLMPSTAEKERERGFSHLEKMFACAGMPMISPFEKTASVSQKHLNREERMAMANAIRLKKDAVLPEKIVLCDDTITTGATLAGALSCFPHENHRIRICTVSYNERWLTDPGMAHCLFRGRKV